MGLHGHRQRFNFPIAQRKEPCVDVLSKDFYHQDGTHLLGGPLLLWLLRFIPPHTGFISGTSACESSPPASERIHSSSSLKTVVEHQLRVEQEAAMFGEVARGPPQSKNIQHSEHAPPLPSAGDGDDGIEVFMPFAWWPWSSHGRQLDVWQRRETRST